ncbi:MAG: hypothetical protein WAU59_07900, partial [Rhodoplanes sp.]
INGSGCRARAALGPVARTRGLAVLACVDRGASPGSSKQCRRAARHGFAFTGTIRHEGPNMWSSVKI